MFKYEVKFWNELVSKENTEKGLLGAKTYEEAFTDLQTYYGKDNIFAIALESAKDILAGEEFENFIKRLGEPII